MKLAFCIFNRATYSRCKALISALSKKSNIDLTVVLSSAALMEEFGNAQAYIQDDFKETKIRFVQLEVNYSDRSPLGMVKAASEIARESAVFFSGDAFDSIIVCADRFETLPCALAASYLNIPLIHIQGGEVTGNIDEKVRHAVTMLSDYHYVSTELAKNYLNHMGQGLFKNTGRVVKTGCPSLDLIKNGKIRRRLSKHRYIICFFHPETERLNEAIEQTNTVLLSVLSYCKAHASVCYWQYPNPDPGRDEIVGILDRAVEANPKYLRKEINAPPEAFLRHLAGARFIIGNSSCGIRECSFLGIPAVNVGLRQANRERGENVMDCDFSCTEIVKLMQEAHDVVRYPRSYLYGTGHSAQMIADRIALTDSFTLKAALQLPYLIEFKDLHFKTNHNVQGRDNHHERTSP